MASRATLSSLLVSFLLIVGGVGCTEEISRQQLAEKVGQPADFKFFADHAVYMGDADGYRYVHVRDLSGPWTMFGECDYKIPANQWPMHHPMRLTHDATQWRDVSWMNGDGPEGVTQNAFLYLTPKFPIGAPATQPSAPPSPAPAASNADAPAETHPASTRSTSPATQP